MPRVKLDEKALEKIAEIICGDEGPHYRKGWEIPRFFRRAGLECPNHDGTSRKWWTLKRLKEYNRSWSKMRKILLRLANPLEYASEKDPMEISREVAGELNKILRFYGLKIVFDRGIPKITEETQTVGIDILFPDFVKLTRDEQIARLLKERWSEMKKCLGAGAYLSAIIHLGSILEGVLVSLAKQNPYAVSRATTAPRNEKGEILPVEQWGLSKLINLAYECGWIERDIKSFSHILKDYRNLVHPWKQRERREYPDKDTFFICLEVVKAAFNDIESYREREIKDII